VEAKRKTSIAAQQPRTKSPPVGKVSKRRDEILLVAAELFAAKGYEETTIREIGDAAGILSGSLYHHFQTKEEMLHDLLRGFILMIPEYQAIVDRGWKSRETICAMIDLALRTVVSNPHTVTITVHERKYLARHPTFAYVETAWKDMAKIWSGVLKKGVEEGVVRDDLDLHLVLRMVNDLIAAAVDWYRPGGRYSIDTIIDTQIALIFGGISRP
jgi:AcrR family transcriptional regulator